MNEFEGVYAPIVGAGPDYIGHQPVVTPDNVVARTSRLREEYEELKKDLMHEISQVDNSMIKPAQDAKESLNPMRKTIKKRDDRKLDFERYQGRVDAGQKKSKRSDRETAAFAKAEADLTRAREEYNMADEHLKYHLNKVIPAVFSLLPHLLASQIQIQNALLAHYYTMLHTFCEQEGFPSPSPPMDEVIRVWQDKFKPIQQEAESIHIISTGKAVRQSMSQDEQNGGRHGNNGYANGYHRRPSGQSSRALSVSPARALPPSPQEQLLEEMKSSKPKIQSLPSTSSAPLLTPATPLDLVRSPSPSEYHTPMYMPAYSPAGPKTDYFSRDRQTSNASLSSQSIASSLAMKKKPPPPPPKRLNSDMGMYVTAIYDFEGQGAGDLVFREGDKIRVLKKTESTDDWWQGELRGIKGSFPANYCD